MSPGDESSYDRWYDGYIDMAHDTNLFSHYSILPDNQMTRAQMSYLVHQLSLDADGTQDLATERDSRSEGCFVSSEPSGTPDSIWVDGIERSYITAIGRNYDHDEPTKLVIAFHGRTSPNDVVRGYYGLEKAWDNESIIIYPAGLPAGSGRSRSDG